MPTAKLSTPMAYILEIAPSDWQRMIVNSATITALSRRGLVSVRMDPKGVSGMMLGKQWKITEAGREVLAHIGGLSCGGH